MQNKSRMYAVALKETLGGVSSKTQEARIKTFKKLLKKRGDLKLTAKILQEFQKVWRERNGRIGELQSARSLPLNLRQHFKKELKKRGFVCEEKIDPSLLGGAALLLGNEYFIDNTVAGKIQKLREQLNTK